MVRPGGGGDGRGVGGIARPETPGPFGGELGGELLDLPFLFRWTDHVGVMRGLVEGQVRLGEWKEKLMNDPTQLMPAYLASAQGQSGWTGAQDERRR